MGSRARWLELVHPDDRTRVEREFARCMAEQSALRIEYRIVCAHGLVRHCEERACVIRGRRGELERLVGFIVDVSDRVRAEQRRVAHLEAIYEGTNVGLGLYDRELRYLSVNQRLAAMSDRPVADHIGRTVRELNPEIADMVEPQLRRVLETATPLRDLEIEYVSQRAPHAPRWWLVSYEPVVTEGEVVAICAVVQEITTRREATRALELAREQAEAASRSKSEFLANISHEIRTPMTAILGYADLLAKQLDDPDNLLCVETIRRNGHYLLEIINDILDLSKIEAGKLQIDRERCKLVDVLLDVHALMEVRALDKNLPLSLERSGLLPVMIETAAKRLRQILLNLIGNAIKFTETGSVRVVAQLHREAELLQIDVIDTGIGIAQEHQANLFEPFMQADASATRGFGGTGLGLTISRRFARMLGGDIQVDSVLGQGSRFTLTLATGSLAEVELIEPDFAAIPRELPPGGSNELPRINVRVLIVDDRTEVRDLVRHYVEEAGGEVSIARNGREALEVVERSAAARPIDVIVMDMQMPVMDGYEATAELRRRGFVAPILALSAHAMAGDRERCLAAGCDAYMTKPLDGRKMLELIAAHHARATRRRSGPSRSPAPEQPSRPNGVAHSLGNETDSARGARVLVVEDSPDLVDMQTTMLELRGHHVRVAQNGREALACARGWEPEFVLLDLGLPDMHGFEVLRELQRFDHLARTRFIALSGCREDDLGRSWREVGFHHYLVKPADLDELMALLEPAAREHEL